MQSIFRPLAALLVVSVGALAAGDHFGALFYYCLDPDPAVARENPEFAPDRNSAKPAEATPPDR